MVSPSHTHSNTRVKILQMEKKEKRESRTPRHIKAL
jgi:hypothetical protein